MGDVPQRWPRGPLRDDPAGCGLVADLDDLHRQIGRTAADAAKALEGGKDANTLDLGKEWTRGNASIAHTLVMAAEIERKRSQDISDDGAGATAVGIWKTLVKMVHSHAPSQGFLQRNLNLLVEYGVLHRDVGAD